MPKAGTVSWQTAPVPQTPLQRGAFLDACVEWLVVAPSTDASERLAPRTAAVADGVVPCASGGWGDTRSGMRLGAKTCGFCEGSEGVRVSVGNPFAGKPWVAVCELCV